MTTTTRSDLKWRTREVPNPREDEEKARTTCMCNGSTKCWTAVMAGLAKFGRQISK